MFVLLKEKRFAFEFTSQLLSLSLKLNVHEIPMEPSQQRFLVIFHQQSLLPYLELQPHHPYRVGEDVQQKSILAECIGVMEPEEESKAEMSKERKGKLYFSLPTFLLSYSSSLSSTLLLPLVLLILASSCLFLRFLFLLPLIATCFLLLALVLILPSFFFLCSSVGLPFPHTEQE